MKDPEQHIYKLILDIFDDLNYSFSAKPADFVDWEKLQIWCFWRDIPLKCFDVSLWDSDGKGSDIQ